MAVRLTDTEKIRSKIKCDLTEVKTKLFPINAFTSGIWKLFDYDFSHYLPYKIFNQPDHEEICYDITDDMELVFTFSPTTSKNKDLIWR